MTVDKSKNIENHPQAKDDVFAAGENLTVVFDVMANDLGGKGKTLYSLHQSSPATVVTTATSALGAQISIVDGKVVYTANSGTIDALAAGETRVDTFTYVIQLGNGALSTATVRVTITGTNDGPVAVADIGAAVEDGGAVVVNVLANDTDVDGGDTKTLVSVDATGATGTVSANPDGTVTYNPGSNFQSLGAGQTATDTFSYTMKDAAGATSTSTVTMTITGTNDGPVAVADGGAAVEDGGAVVVDVLANDTDVDSGDTKTLVSVDATGTTGTVSANPDGTVTYNPGSNFQSLGAGQTATDTFSYTMKDAAGATSTATVTMTITGTNDGPVAVADTGAAVEDGGAVVVNVLANDTDVDSGDTKTLVSVDGAGTIGTVTANPDGTVTYNPGSNFQSLGAGQTATDTFSYTMRDAAGVTSTATVTMTITGTNDAPTLTAGQTFSGAVSFYEAEGNAIDTIGGNNGTAQNVAYGPGHDGQAFSFNGSNYVSIANQIPTNFTIVGWFNTSTNSLSGNQFYHGNGLVYADVGGLQNDFGISILNNRLAFGTGGNFDSTIQSTSIVTTGEWVSFAAVRNGSVISIYINGNLEASHDTTYSGPLTSPTHITLGANVVDGRFFTGQLDDLAIYNRALSAAEIQQHAVLGNATMVEAFGVTGSSALLTGSVELTLTDADLSDSHTVILGAPTLTLSAGSAPPGLAAAMASAATAAVTTPSQGTGVGAVTVSFSAADSTFDFLAQGQTLTAVYEATVSDGHGGTAVQPVTFTVIGANDAPTAVSDTFSTLEDTPVTINVRSNDTDPDQGAVLNVTHVNNTAISVNGTVGVGNGGVVRLNADGTLTYTPGLNDNGSRSFSYTVRDEHGATSTANVSGTVTPVNDPAVIGGTANGSVSEDNVLSVSGQLSVVDVDTGEGAFQPTPVGSPLVGAYGSLTLSSSGAWTYALNNGHPAVQALTSQQTLTDNLVVHTIDGTAQTISITINGQNEPQLVQFLSNFSFENVPTSAAVQGLTQIAGWTNVGGTLLEICDTTVYGVGGDGHWLDTQASPGGITISQAVDLLAGQTATLSVNVAKVLGSGGLHPGSTLSFQFNGQVVLTLSESDFANWNQLETFTVQVTGQTGLDTLTIHDSGGGLVGYALDWVKLEGWVF